MLKQTLTFALIALLNTAISSKAIADTPSVVTDIAPVHSLVAQVMGELGEPYLLIRKGASPHDYALRPSEAKALQNASIVFWIGESLTPWLGDSVKNRAGSGESIELIQSDGTIRLPFRKGVKFSHHQHGTGDHEPVQMDADSKYDPHAWLDPHNAIVWLDVIAAALAEQDPENAQTYVDNAATSKALIKQLIIDTSVQFGQVRTTKFIVYHDSYQYFENVFNVSADSAISLSDGIRPSASRIAEIRKHLEENSIKCVLAGPQHNKKLLTSIVKETKIQLIVVDALGTELPLGANLYQQLIQRLADSIVECTS